MKAGEAREPLFRSQFNTQIGSGNKAPSGARERGRRAETPFLGVAHASNKPARKVLQIRKYQKPAFCVAAEGRKGETRARAGGELGRRLMRYLVLVLCRRASKTASAGDERPSLISAAL